MVQGKARQGDQSAALIAQLRRGVLEYCVMALLREEERYAFELVRVLADMDGMVISEGTIYPMLSRLRRDGLVETSWRESPTGPPRRYYRLSTGGRKALREFKHEWSTFRRAVDHLLSKEESDG
jgi:PadR family transcriptional regulator, regulatory protein PadR